MTTGNANATSLFLFLYHIINVFKEYFRELEEESIRDNFVVIYELLDEMMDFGYPQVLPFSSLSRPPPPVNIRDTQVRGI